MIEITIKDDGKNNSPALVANVIGTALLDSGFSAIIRTENDKFDNSELETLGYKISITYKPRKA